MFFPEMYKGAAAPKKTQDSSCPNLRKQQLPQPEKVEYFIKMTADQITNSRVLRYSDVLRPMYRNHKLFRSILEYPEVPNANPVLDPSGDLRTNSALVNPSVFMPALTEAIRDELAFYSHDLNGKIMFLSKSAEQVFNQDPKLWLNRMFSDLLTDAPFNTHIRSSGSNESPESTSAGRVCEIFDRGGSRLRLKYWRVHVIQDGVVVGIAGIVRRLHYTVPDAESNCTEKEKEIMCRVGGLTDVEKTVIDMVVDGNMNKEIAAVLKVAVRTVESRRSRAMAKLQSKTLSELVQTWVQVRRIEASRKSEDSSVYSLTSMAKTNEGAWNGCP